MNRKVYSEKGAKLTLMLDIQLEGEVFLASDPLLCLFGPQARMISETATQIKEEDYLGI